MSHIHIAHPFKPRKSHLMSAPWYAVSKQEHGAFLAYLVVTVRLLLLTVWFFVACLLGCIICIFQFRSPDIPRIVCSFYSPVSAWLAGIRLVQHNWQHTLVADNSAVYVANHQTFLDLSFFGQQLPKNTVCVAKSDLKWVPVRQRFCTLLRLFFFFDLVPTVAADLWPFLVRVGQHLHRSQPT
jgi:hypothetical protein